jgi:hypothetical protein
MNQHADAVLRSALERTADGLEDNPERYDQVAARVRRRQRRVIGVGGAFAAVLLLTLGFAVAFGAGQPQRSPAGDPAAIDCGSPVAVPAPESARFVPEGAVAVRPCGLVDITIRQDVDRLVAALSRLEQPVPGGEPACADVYNGPPYQLRFAYPDGRQLVATVERTACPPIVQVGDRVRLLGGSEITDLVYELAEAQRWADAPTDPPDPACPDPRTLTRPTGDESTPPRFDALVVNPTQSVPYPAVAVAVCRYDSTDPSTARLVTSALVTDGAERARELVNGQGPEIPFWSCDPPAGWFDVLVFADEAGGTYEVRVGRGDCQLFYSAHWLSDEPEPALRQWLDDTLG